MKIIASIAGAFLSSALLMALVDIFTPGNNILNIPLFAIFFITWGVGFGYAAVEASLKKKIVAVLVIESIALTGCSAYFIVTRNYREYILGLALGLCSLFLMILLKWNNAKPEK